MTQWQPIKPNDLSGTAALLAAGATAMCKQKGEYDTEFVKRIVAAYMNAHMLLAGDDGEATPGKSK